MTDPSALRVAVITTEARSISNRLWVAARDRVDDLVVIGPESDGTEELPDFQIELPTRQVFKENHTFSRLAGLNGVLDDFRPDIIHVNGEAWSVNVLQTVFRHDGVIPHGAENQFFVDGTTPAIRYGIAKAVARASAGYASWNVAGADALAGMRRDLPTLVMPAIIPPPTFVPGAWVGPTESEPFRIVLVARMVEMKGFDRVIRAVASLPTKDQFEVHLCGVGQMAEVWQSLGDELGVRVVQRGMLTPDVLFETLVHAGALVQSSLTTRVVTEQFGRSVAEAMTVGVPCLSSTSGELPNVVGDPWCTFGEDDVEGLAHKLEVLRADPERRASVSQSQVERARRWSPEMSSQTLVEFWAECWDHQEARPGLLRRSRRLIRQGNAAVQGLRAQKR